MLKIAFSSNAFRRYSLVETIEILARLGYHGIEIMADTPHAYPPDLGPADLEAIQAALDRTGLDISNINAFMLHAVGDTWRPSWIEKDPSARSVRVQHTIRCIELAEKLGAATVSTEPGGPLEGMDAEEGMRLFLEGLRTVEPVAREKGVRVLIEPEPGLLIENSLQFLACYGELDPVVFGLNFDIGHFFCVGEDPAALVGVLNDATHHYHLEDIAATRTHHHLLPGEGAIDLKTVLSAIEGTGYGGFVTVELYPYEARPVETAQEALRYLRGVMS
jgi:sugar phosphate isomerase/epimerase